jgi:hypothetical protein
VHEGGFSVERTSTRSVRFRAPDGRLIRPAPECRPARGHGLEMQHRARGWSVDAWTCSPKHPEARLDYHHAVEVLVARALAAG